MFEHVEKALAELKAVVAGLDPSLLHANDAARLVELFAEGERICAAGRILLAVRAEESGHWRSQGYSTPAAWMAAKTGTSMSQAISTMDAACRLEELPATEAALRAGQLSSSQVAEVTAAASASPAAEGHLLQTAARRPLSGLREECQRVKAAARFDESAAERRIHRARHLRRWTDAEGAFCFAGRTTNGVGAQFWAAIEAEATAVFESAQDEGRFEPSEAYLLDALANLVLDQGSSVTPNVVNVIVALAFLSLFGHRRSLLGHPFPAGGLGLPHGRLTGGTVNRPPDPNGIVTFHTHEQRPGWAPSKPRGQRCSHDRNFVSGRRLPHLNGNVPAPRSSIHRPRLHITRHHQRFTCVHPSGLPQPVAPGWGRSPWAFPEASNPAVTSSARPGGDRHRAPA